MTDLASYMKTKWTKEDPKMIVQQIGEARQLPTEAFGMVAGVGGHATAEYRTQLVQAGAVDHIIAFLLKTDKPFDEVIQGGDLICPSTWLNVLNLFCQDGFLEPEALARQTKYKIVINMGPLFQDMSNFETRQLFGSKDAWIKSLPFFTSMVSGLLASEFSKISDFLVRQASLKDFLVRVLFLEIGDPEIKSEIEEYVETRDKRIVKPDIIGTSQTYCAYSIKSLMIKRGKQYMEEFAETPIRPEHSLTLTSAIIKLFENSQRDNWYKGGYSAALSIFIMLYDHYDRLSSDFGVESASAKMVTICQTHLTKYLHLVRDRYFLESVMTGIVTLGATMMTPAVNQQQAAIDYNVANAIRSGLFYFCLDVCDSNEIRAATALDGLLKVVQSTAGLPDTKKALQETGEAVRCRLERVLARVPYLHTGLNLIHAILKQSIPPPPPNESIACEFCFEKCTKGTTTKCPFCRTVTYCSKDCQRLNWMLHQTTCYEKRKTPLPKTDDEIVDDGKVIFAKHINQILFQASLKNVNMLDILAIFDMSEATPLFQTLRMEQFADMYVQDEETVANAKKVMEKNKASGSLTAVFIGFTEDGLLARLVGFPPETTPLIPGLNGIEPMKKWEIAQQVVAHMYAKEGGIKQIQSHQPLLRASILKTMKP
eukprot:scaffold241_cov89-Cylindrotheca_fusiformis.AAC.7